MSDRSRPGRTKASIAARKRELQQAEREADIEKVVWLEKDLVTVHHRNFPPACRVELPPPEDVDPQPICSRLEQDAGIPQLLATLGGGEVPPVAPSPEPVDRYVLMREHRKKERHGIPIFRIADRIRAAQKADREAEVAAGVETERRREAQQRTQERLDGYWAELQEARSKVDSQLPVEIKTERQRREAEREKKQAQMDDEWNRLQANDPMVTMLALEEAFADNESPAAPLNCEGSGTTIVMRFPQPEEIVPERKPARTPRGKRTLKKRTKTEINDLYLEALGSNILATVKEAFAVAPGTEIVQMLVIRRETDKKSSGSLAAIYIGEFDRAGYENESAARDLSSTITTASEAMLCIKGKTRKLGPIDLSGQPDLQKVLEQVADGLNESDARIAQPSLG